MDRPRAKSCSTAGRTLPGRLATPGSLRACRLAPCLLLVLLVCPAGGQPVAEQELLEAVKAGILGSLGLEEEPRPAQKASEEELRRVYRSYWETLREMGGNSSQAPAEAGQRSSVAPGTAGRGEEERHVMTYSKSSPHICRPNRRLRCGRAMNSSCL